MSRESEFPDSSRLPPALETGRPIARDALVWLERLTALVLLLVLLALGWMVLVAYVPETLRLANLEAEVWSVIGLLTTALVLVSVVALWHTRT